MTPGASPGPGPRGYIVAGLGGCGTTGLGPVLGTWVESVGGPVTVAAPVQGKNTLDYGYMRA